MLSATGYRTQTFGRGAVIMRAQTGEGLSDGDIARGCPAIFAADKHSSRSDRYTYISTRDLLAGLRQNGLVPIEVRQGGSRDDEKRAYTKHMIRLRHQEATPINGLFPEVVLLNSHDGTSSYRMDFGLFRIICTNGLVAFDALCEGVRVPHKGNVLDNVVEGAFRVLAETPRVIDNAAELSAVQLTPGEQEAFARSAALLRWERNAPQPEPRALLAPRRGADTGGDLWSVFNRVQENVIRGGLHYTVRNERNELQSRSSRPVRNIDGDRSLNQALWALAEEMRNLKAAA